MNKFTRTILSFIATDVFYYFCYILFDEAIPAVVTTLIGWLLFHFVIKPALKKMKFHKIQMQDMNQIINALVLQISVTPSLYTSLEAIFPNLSISLQEKIGDIREEAPLDVMERLNFGFNHPVFSIFNQILKLYVEQGGDIIAMTQQIVNQANQVKTYTMDYLQVKNKKMKELLVSWGFSWLTMIYMRYLLSQYYLAMVHGGFLLFAVIIGFGLFFWSLFLFFKQYKEMTIEKGWET